jgi:F-type H+-transporting ATPase subunit b
MLAEAEFWVAVAFVIFIGVMIYFGVHKLIVSALDQRSDRIRGELDEARRTKMAETKIAQAEAQAVADVRAAAADAAVAAAEKILTQTVKGSVADDLLTKGIAELKSKLN